MNFVRLRGPSKEHSFHIRPGPLRPNPIVIRCIEKFTTPQQFTKIMSFRRSIATAEALIEDFNRADLPKFEMVRDETYFRALAITTKIMKPKFPTKPVHFCDTRMYPWTTNTAVEAPYGTDPIWKKKVQEAFERGDLESARLTFHNLYNVVYNHARPVIHIIKEGKRKRNQFLYPRTAHARAHLVSEDKPDKIRMVFGVSKVHLIVEVMLLWDYMRQLRQQQNPHILWGYEMLNGGMLKLFSELSNPLFHTFLCFDFSKFDKYLLFSLIDDIHGIIRSYSSKTTYYFSTQKGKRASFRDHRRIDNLWAFMSEFVKHAPNLLPDGSLWKFQFNGLPSGLLQTQLVDCFANLIINITILLEMEIFTTEQLIKVLGDDSIIGLFDHIPPDQHVAFHKRFAEIAWRRFRIIVAPLGKKSKMTNSPNGTYCLGYYCHNGFPHRDELELLAALMHRERPTTAAQLRAVSIGIAYASAGRSDLVYNVCREIFNEAGKFTDDIETSSFARPTVLQDVFGLHPDDFSDFPTLEKIRYRLLTPPTPVVSGTWNTDFFMPDSFDPDQDVEFDDKYNY